MTRSFATRILELNLSDHRGRKCRSSNKCYGAPQTGMLLRWNDVDLSCAAKLGQRSLAQSTAHDWFDQAPGCRDFAADVNASGIERVYERSETKPEITCRGIECG